MALLLNLLEKESDAVYARGEPDLELMRDIMRYMSVYPDAVHHPKEDRLYAELRAARPDLAKGMAKITSEHRAIAEQSVALQRDLEVALFGEKGNRQQIVADAARYIESLREHMRWEETDLFKRLDKMIADGHAVIDASVFVDRRDPLFGTEVEADFELLFGQITRT